MATQGPQEDRGGRARVFVAIGLVLQGLEGGLLFVLWYLLPPRLAPTNIFLYLGAAGVVCLVLVYAYAYIPISQGSYERARTPTIIFAAVSILTAGVPSGLLYAFAHHELEPARVLVLPAQPRPEGGPLSSGWKTCPACQAPNPSSTMFCRSCGLLLT